MGAAVALGFRLPSGLPLPECRCVAQFAAVKAVLVDVHDDRVAFRYERDWAAERSLG